MKFSQLSGAKLISQPKVSVADSNNPFNMKVGTATQDYIQQGQASVGRAAPDGGFFLNFKDRNTAINAAKNLLFNSGVYTGLTVDAALKKWSNNGYGGNVIPSLSGKNLSDLTPDEQTQVLNAMETKGENDAVPKGTTQFSSFKPGQLSLVKAGDMKAPAPKASGFQEAMAGAKDFAKGARETLAAPIVNTGELIQEGLDQTVGRGINLLLGKGNKPTSENDILNPNSPEGQKAQAKLNAPVGTAGEVGKAVGTVAPYLVPESKAADAASIGEKAVAFGTRFAKNAAVGAAQTKSLIQGVETAAGAEVLTAAGAVTKAFSGTIGKMFIPKSDAEAAALQTYKAGKSLISRVGNYLAGTSKAPITAGATAFEKGFAGTESMIGVQAKRAQNKLWSKIINPALKASNVKVDMEEFFKTAEDAIKKDTPELTRQNVLLNALNAVKEDYAGVKSVSLSALQDLKKGWAEFVPEKAYKGQPIAGALNDVRNTLADQARNHIYTALGDNIKQAYLDYGNLYDLTAMGRKAMANGMIKPGGTASLIKNLLERTAMPFATIGGQTLYKIGQLGTFAGAAGAATLRDLFLGSGDATTNQNPQSQAPYIPIPEQPPQATPPQTTQ